MFSIGDPEWPGISKLVEEMGETQQVCGKLMGTGGKLDHWDGQNLKNSLEEELADLIAAIKFVIGHCELDERKIEERIVYKLGRFVTWHNLGAYNKKAL
jgi:NTP pyrophosphatase (non-canonical NTP hydrolase)